MAQEPSVLSARPDQPHPHTNLLSRRPGPWLDSPLPECILPRDRAMSCSPRHFHSWKCLALRGDSNSTFYSNWHSNSNRNSTFQVMHAEWRVTEQGWDMASTMGFPTPSVTQTMVHMSGNISVSPQGPFLLFLSSSVLLLRCGNRDVFILLWTQLMYLFQQPTQCGHWVKHGCCYWSERKPKARRCCELVDNTDWEVPKL